ncbi:MAG: YARHG domain-containing protein, partial [Deltaproteobacteria bacterium]|nr:YARHG domain-containing protein [Deltaproteobacteria bacterium]
MMRWTIGLGVLLLSSVTLSNTALASRAAQPVSTPSACDHETLSQMDKAQLRIKRNTVFARYGRSFRSADLKAYFGAQPWYKPNPAYSDSLVKPLEKACVDRMRLWEKGARPTWSVAVDFNGDSRKERAFIFDRRVKEHYDGDGCTQQFIVAVENETYRPCVPMGSYKVDISAIDIDRKDNRQEILVTTHLAYDIDPPIYNWILAHSGTGYTVSTLIGVGDSGGALTIKGDGIVRMEDFEIHGGGRHCRYITNEKSYPLKNGTFPKPTVKMVQTHRSGCAACPFVEVWTQQGWVRIGEILRHIDAPEKKSWDKLSLVHT